MAIVPYRQTPLAPYSPSYNQYFPVEYFSGMDISFFFGNQYIDEVFSLEFELVEKVMPIYSYSDYSPRRIITGSRIVQGSFQINLRPGNYMHELLYKLASSTTTAQPSDSFSPPVNLITSPPDPSTNPAGYQNWKLNQQATIWGGNQPSTEVDLAAQPYFINGGFSILIVYGDLDAIDMTARNPGKVRSIDMVTVYGVGQRVEASADNVRESFRFIAGDINGQQRSQSGL